MEKNQKINFLNRIILAEEDKNSLSQENEYDLEYMLNDFLQENNNNFKNNIKIKNIKNNFYDKNIYNDKYKYKENKKQNENINNKENPKKFSVIHKGNKTQDNFCQKKIEQKNLKKILAQKNSFNNEKKYSQISSIRSSKINNIKNFKRAKSLINGNIKENKKFFRNSEISSVGNSSKNKTYNNNKNLSFNKNICASENKENKIINEIKNIISNYEKDKTITFDNFQSIFNELKIFQNTIYKIPNKKFENEIKISKKENDKIYKNNDIKIIDYSAQYTSNNTFNSNIKKKEEQEDILIQKEKKFYSQLWMIINSSSNERINSNIFFEILKQLFTSNNIDLNQKSNKIKKYLYSIYNNAKNKKFICPLTKRELSIKEIWSIERVIKEFFELYPNNETTNFKINKYNFKIYNKNNIREINFNDEKENSHSIKNKYINILELTKEKNKDFLYERQKLKIHKLEEIKNKKKNIQEYSFKPKINNNYFIKKKNKKSIYRNVSKNSSINNKENISEINLNKMSVYEKLYQLDKEKRDKQQKLMKENLIKEEKKSLEECTFKPNIIKSNSFTKCFNNNNIPKGYEEYKYKIRKAIAQNEKRKYEENK